MNRRDFLKKLGFGTAAVISSPLWVEEAAKSLMTEEKLQISRGTNSTFAFYGDSDSGLFRGSTSGDFTIVTNGRVNNDGTA